MLAIDDKKQNDQVTWYKETKYLPNWKLLVWHIYVYMYWYMLDLALNVRRGDNAIQWINLYLLDSAVCFANTYPLDSDLFFG